MHRAYPPPHVARRRFPIPTLNEWTDEGFIDDDDNATVCYSSRTAAGTQTLTYDLGSPKSFSMGGRALLYNSNAVLTVGLRISLSDDGITYSTVWDNSHKLAATVAYNIVFMGLTRFIKFEAYYYDSTGARSVTIPDLNLVY